MAYCLLGLVQVNMPMMYGEGQRAFNRLQLEILKKSNEHSIFAWELPGAPTHQSAAVLEPSPRGFQGASDIKSIPSQRPLEASSHEITNNGLRITLPVIRIGQDRIIGLLDCRTKSDAIVGIWLETADNGRYRRLPGSRLAIVTDGDAEEAELLDLYLLVDNTDEESVGERHCRIRFPEILSNVGCFVNGVFLFSGGSVTKIKEPYPIISPRTVNGIFKKVMEPYQLLRLDSVKDQHAAEVLSHAHTRYLLEELVLEEGYSVRIGLGIPEIPETVILEVLLLHGLPQMLVEEEYVGTRLDHFKLAAYNAGKFDEFQFKGWSLREDSALGYGIVVLTSGKKRLVNGRPEWAIAIKVFRCHCGRAQWKRDSCICDISFLKWRRLGRQGPEGFECGGSVCTACKRHILSVRAPLCICHACHPAPVEKEEIERFQRWVCDECKQLVDQASGMHYLECPCSICERDSRSETFSPLAWLACETNH